MDCVGIASVSPEKLLEAHWQDKSITRYTFNIVLQCQDQPGILLDIFSVLNSLNLNISKIHSETVATKMQDVYITSDTSYPSKIGYLLQEFKKREDSVKVVKREII
ncbi:MAG: ACT domain-containing protein [bacterium]